MKRTKPKMKQEDFSGFSRADVKKICVRIEEVVKQCESEFGVTITDAGGRFQTSEITMKLRIQKVGCQSVEERDYEFYQQYQNLGLPPLGTIICLSNEEFRIAGWRRKAKKNKVLIVRTRDGVKFVSDPETVKRNVV